MRILRAAAVATVVVLSGAALCSAMAAVPNHKRGKSDDYISSDPSSGLRAFIYADHTVLQLDSYKSALQVVDDSGGTIGYTQDGRFANIAGKLNHFTAYVNGQRIEFTRAGWTPPRPIQLAATDIAPGVTLDADETEIAAPAPGKNTKPVTKAATAAPASAPKSSAGALPPLLPTSTGAGTSLPVGASSPAASRLTAATAITASAPAAASAATASVTPASSVAAKAPLAAPTPAVAASAAASASLAVASVTVPDTKDTAADPATVVQTWHIEAGQPIGVTLAKWGARVNWKVDWQYPRDIVAPNSVDYTTDFITASSKVIETLHNNGALIYTRFSKGNRYQRIWKSGAIDAANQ